MHHVTLHHVTLHHVVWRASRDIASRDITSRDVTRENWNGYGGGEEGAGQIYNTIKDGFTQTCDSRRGLMLGTELKLHITGRDYYCLLKLSPPIHTSQDATILSYTVFLKVYTPYTRVNSCRHIEFFRRDTFNGRVNSCRPH